MISLFIMVQDGTSGDSGSSISQRVALLKEKIDSAAMRSGQDAGKVRIMAVTKTHSIESVQAAYDAGIRLFGENRSDELTEKYSTPQPNAEVHMIGHLQRNKAAVVAAIAHCVESIDKYSTAASLQKACEPSEKQMPVLLEYNTSGEESKHGFRSLETSYEDIERIIELPNIEIHGVMTIAPFTNDVAKVRSSFCRLHEIFDTLELRYSLGMDIISMGMTSDFEIAVEEGSTLIRIGSFLFGARESR